MTNIFIYSHTGTILKLLKLYFYGGINVLNRLFIEGRFYDPIYNDREWLSRLRRFFRRSK